MRPQLPATCEYFTDVRSYWHKAGTKHSIASTASYPNGRFDVQENTHTLLWDDKVNHGLDRVSVDDQDPHLQVNPGITLATLAIP